MSSEHEIKPAMQPRFAAWLMEPMRRNRPVYLKVALAAVVINIFGLLTSLFTMIVYDRVVPNNATSSLVALSIGLAIGGAVVAVAMAEPDTETHEIIAG